MPLRRGWAASVAAAPWKGVGCLWLQATLTKRFSKLHSRYSLQKYMHFKKHVSLPGSTKIGLNEYEYALYHYSEHVPLT